MVEETHTCFSAERSSCLNIDESEPRIKLGGEDPRINSKCRKVIMLDFDKVMWWR